MNACHMHYNQVTDQWLIELQGREYALHCGESFELYIGKTPVPCQLELADKWYVIMDDISFYLKGNSQYKIKL